MTKKVPFNRAGIRTIPLDKPIIYEILTEQDRPNYVGIAKRGRSQERLLEHLPGAKDPIPGHAVRVRQFSTIQDARRTEKKMISTNNPKYNETQA